MKTNYTKVAYCTIFFFSFNIISYSQDNWTWLNPKPMGSSVESCGYFPGTNTIIAVGASGLIMRSTDNGTNWSHIQSNLSSKLNSVSIINSTTAYVAGDDITLLKTTDAGATWTSVSTTGISGSIAQVQFMTETNAFLRIENTIYKSVNSGVDWSSIITNSDGSLSAMCAISETKLFYGTTNGSLYSANYSGLWLSSYIDIFSNLPWPKFVKAIVSNGNNIAAFSNSEQIFVSTNSGVNWNTATLAGLNYACATFMTGDDLVAVTTDERIVTSTDGGLNWGSASPAGSANVTTISHNLSGNGIILGSGGIQHNSNNSGSTWSITSDSETLNQLNSIFTLNGTTIWAAGNNGAMIKSTDGGNSWFSLTSGITDTIKDIKFVSDLTGYFVAKNKIYKSIDGGVSWAQNKAASTGVYLNEISALNQNEIIVVGSSKNTYYTINGGDAWNLVTVATDGELISVHYSGTSTAYCAGNSGKVFKTTDKGVTWSAGASATGTLNSIWFSTPAIGWAVGKSGKIYKSVDYGGSWILNEDGLTTNHLHSVRFFDENNGLIVGNNGVIYKTTDGGTTWTKSAQITGNNLMSAALIDGSTTLVAGYSGTVIKSYNAPLPVELTTFTAAVRNNTVNLNWETATEVDNYGFEIERKDKHSTWTKIGFIEGHFTSNSPKYYSFSDKPSGSSKYSYRLKQIDNDGKFEYSGIVEVDLSGMLPKDIEIKNFPNPFNPETNINIKLPETAETTVELYNSTGEKIFTIYKGKLESGTTLSLRVDGSNLPSGVYLINVSAGKYRKTHKILLMK